MTDEMQLKLWKTLAEILSDKFQIEMKVIRKENKNEKGKNEME